MQHNVIDELQERGFVQDITSEQLQKLVEKPIKIYCGFDPTGESLHVGHLVPIMGLAHFQRAGHTAVCLVGGATGMIGDPSGKSKERNLLTEEEVQSNVAKIHKQIGSILPQKHDNPPLFLNNADWFSAFSFIDFLRDVGRYFRINTMLSKESVKSRLSSDEGMSFTEFCYQTLQGFDFLHLYDKFGVIAEMGGQDQWGNITAGIELVRKVRGIEVFGLTFPLLTRSDGKKFGKTEEGAVWLSKEKTSAYDFYQYFFRMPDADVIKLMRLLTFMELDEIREIEVSMKNPDYKPNSAQARLAEEVTRLIHGEEELTIALKTTQLAKPGAEAELSLASLQALATKIPLFEASRGEVVNGALIDLLANLGVLSSKGEGRRLVRGGGLYLNNSKVDDEAQAIKAEDLVGDRLLLISLGKKKKVLISVD